MSILPTSINASSIAAEAARLAQLQQGLAPNSVVTASYQFKVGSDGSLTATEAKITSQPAQEEAAKQDGQRTQNQQQATGTLDDVTRPRVQLSPSDELALFANTQENEHLTAQHEAQKDAQSALEAFAQEGTQGNPSSLEAQAQVKAAGLYARNSDIIYNVNPIISEAA